MINEKSTDPIQKFYAEGTEGIGHMPFLQSAGVLECCSPPSKSKDVQYKSGTSIFSTNKDLTYEEGTSSVQMRMYSTGKVFHQ